MRIAITGHTQGIGKALSELYPESIGLSRTNGFDISNPEARENIINMADDLDVFVNNAYDKDNQIIMYREFFKLWQYDKSKTIVNISSRVASEDPNTPHEENALSAITNQGNYIANKNLLSMESNPGKNYDRLCRIININPGWVATRKVPEEWLLEQGYPYITASECAQYIKWAIDQDLEIGELSFWRRK